MDALEQLDAALKGRLTLKQALRGPSWLLYAVIFAAYWVLNVWFEDPSVVPFLAVLPLVFLWAAAIWQCAMNGVPWWVGVHLRLCLVAGAVGMLVLLLVPSAQR